ncbi:hypothetical protein [Burkholderia ubonensis]|uniref:hypothetical protein n=1 Tax=Burkholderia ubonensis TaxID=101571 RepID=UPI0039F4F6B4
MQRLSFGVSIDKPSDETRYPDEIDSFIRYGRPLLAERATRQGFRHGNATTRSCAKAASVCSASRAERLAERRAHVDTAAMIRDYLGSTPGAPPFSLEDMARLMNTSARKLKRRLQDEGTTFRALLGESRGAMAEALLGDERLTLTEVALDNGRAGSAQRGRRGYGLDVRIVSLLLTGMPRIHRRRDACEAIRCIERTPRRDSQDRRSQSRVECARIRVCPARRRHG